MPPSPPVPARTMTALNCLLAAGLTVLHYRLVILSKETAAQRSGLLQIKQAIDPLWLSEERFCCVTWHPRRSWWEALDLTLPWLNVAIVIAHLLNLLLDRSAGVRELHDDLQGQDFIFGKTDWVLLLAVAISLIIFPYMYLARNTELQNWGLSF